MTAEDGPDYSKGDTVLITAGLYADALGEVVGYDGNHDLYFVRVDDVGTIQALFPSMLDDLDDEDDEDGDEEDQEEGYPMPDTPIHGMTSEQLADYVSDFIVACTTRVKGVGDEQYSEGTHQKFEAMAIDELLEWAEEEVQDLAVYAAMLHIRLRRVRQALKPNL
jgi:hypothetical protein